MHERARARPMPVPVREETADPHLSWFIRDFLVDPGNLAGAILGTETLNQTLRFMSRVSQSVQKNVIMEICPPKGSPLKRPRNDAARTAGRRSRGGRERGERVLIERGTLPSEASEGTGRGEVRSGESQSQVFTTFLRTRGAERGGGKLGGWRKSPVSGELKTSFVKC